MIDYLVPEKPAQPDPGVHPHTADDWLTGATSPGVAEPPGSGQPSRIGHYAIERRLGQGGMGVVYAARDERLRRTVAVKTMGGLARGEDARRRFWREARAAASVNHPNVCQIYEIGEDGGELFIAMELLEGEVLSDRLRRGALAAADATGIAVEMLAALEALHARGIVHRDLKPSNVFLTSHGVKLLDFGLARHEVPAGDDDPTQVTRAGLVLGTPRYMAPEQATAADVDARADLFATGAILFEMLAGRPAFGGRSAVEVLHATRYEQPPALTGSAAVAAIDRVIRRALAKRPEDRPASAAQMAAALHAIRGAESTDTLAAAHPLTRLVVLPFRVLRPDEDTDFLAFSLPDAITTSLTGVASLVLRSSVVAARFASGAPDLRALAAEADVDRVVTGTLLRAGNQLRVTTQLLEVPAGTVLASHAVQAATDDLFQLQDDLARRVVEALSLPLSGEPTPSLPDAPRDPRAYVLYLRANELARTYDGMAAARDLYQRAVDLDPRFALAWARLGRCHRVLGKYVDGAAASEARAEKAFRRALALDPRLSLAHKFFANLEADIGHSQQAVVRLLGEATRHGTDAELFAGLVHACRYSGLFDQAIAAHAEARRLDPHVPTTLEQTLLVAGQTERLLAIERPPVDSGADDGIRVIALGMAGRRTEAREQLRAMRNQGRIPAFQSWMDHLQNWLDRNADAMLSRLGSMRALKIQEDPEAIFQEGWLLCDAGRPDVGLELLRRGVSRGYFAAATLTGRPQFDPLRSDPGFQRVLAEAAQGRARALEAFDRAGGERLLGP
jgi:eukaryotic-like serine/threonine-protein kinase